MSENYVILDWDSNFFSCRIARFRDVRTTRDEIERVVAACRQARVDCLYFLADADHIETIEALEANNFGLKDIRMTYVHNLASSPRNTSLPPELPARIRPVQVHEIAKLEAIARVSHSDTRFYFDKQFSRERAADLYQTWIRRSCEGGANIVLVAEGDAQDGPIGYISCHLSDTNCQIGLVAVDEQARSRGIGQQLVRAALHWFNTHDASTVHVVTQGRNVPAQRLYQKTNFTLESIQLWYHKWFEHSFDMQ